MTFPFPFVTPNVLIGSKFIGATSNASAAGSLSWPSGTALGDIAIVVFGSGSTASPISASGWATKVQGDGTTSTHLAVKKLTATDISTPPSYSTTNGFAAVYIYRGGNSVQVKDAVSGSGASLTLSGFTKSLSSRKIVSPVCDRDPTGNPATPTGWNGRARSTATYFSIEAADLDPSDYTDSTSINWSGFVGSLLQSAYLLEITDHQQFARYFAYGDSNTAGTLVSTAYPTLVASHIGATLTNKAASGGQAADQSNTSNSDTLEATDLSSILIGGNDQWHYGTDVTKMGYYENCLRRLILNRTVISRVNARDAGMTKTGTWTNTSVNSVGMYATATGAKCSCSVSGTAIYVGFILQAGAGSATVKVDGVVKATVNCEGTGVDTYTGGTYGAAAIRIDGLSAGSHTVEIETLEAANVYIDFVAGNLQTDKPEVWLSNLLKVISPSDPSNYYEAGRVETYNSIVSSVGADLIGDGLNIKMVDCFNAVDAADFQSDGIHPTSAGQLEMEAAFAVKW